MNWFSVAIFSNSILISGIFSYQNSYDSTMTWSYGWMDDVGWLQLAPVPCSGSWRSTVCSIQYSMNHGWLSNRENFNRTDSKRRELPCTYVQRMLWMSLSIFDVLWGWLYLVDYEEKICLIWDSRWRWLSLTIASSRQRIRVIHTWNWSSNCLAS